FSRSLIRQRPLQKKSSVTPDSYRALCPETICVRKQSVSGNNQHLETKSIRDQPLIRKRQKADGKTRQPLHIRTDAKPASRWPTLLELDGCAGFFQLLLGILGLRLGN